MIRLAHIIKKHEKDFLKKYARRLLPSHFKAIQAIKICRSQQSPKMLMQCGNADCSHKLLLMHSCGHRHCPHCQNHETQAWIDKQIQKQVPADYFMITFTLPAQLRR
ncbi:MAG TPA: IS91 family transposase, partial [Bacteroidetes bacterium]|nr:IS91 family transposase [Bacteroidota bacterium]